MAAHNQFDPRRNRFTMVADGDAFQPVYPERTGRTARHRLRCLTHGKDDQTALHQPWNKTFRYGSFRINCGDTRCETMPQQLLG